MDLFAHSNFVQRRDAEDSTNEHISALEMNHLAFVFFALVASACFCCVALCFLRRRRMARRQQATSLPTYHQVSHHQRSPSVTNFGNGYKNESVFVYDEKMNLIHNSSSPTSTSVPEIHITFPDEEGKPSNSQNGRVVVVHITDSGSVGMGPLQRDDLPPYQKEDADRFQSLDLERIGGLREKEPLDRR
ncbi:hypothetical protein PV10_05721 [Exophiala mesophila]|uniref:Uncharacterized protein n=1 Tax=Exophiala mesophila TaxID=212818 RepID=A0A0D1ZWH0_EXOME|nr:uncharacterized protein PV10_05721 [Exophiala mesophila]KIV91148.1 hypothetical protein PV10_05721 [Exophiala mesophila]